MTQKYQTKSSIDMHVQHDRHVSNANFQVLRQPQPWQVQGLANRGVNLYRTVPQLHFFTGSTVTSYWGKVSAMLAKARGPPNPASLDCSRLAPICFSYSTNDTDLMYVPVVDITNHKVRTSLPWLNWAVIFGFSTRSASCVLAVSSRGPNWYMSCCTMSR